MPYPVVAVERSGALVMLTPSGSEWYRRALHPSGRWPSWNPARDLLAISVIEQRGEGLQSELHLINTAGTLVRVAHSGGEDVPPVIAPRLPHYALWSPAGDVLSYVAPSEFGLGLFLTHADGTFISDPIITGAPLFHSWCGDNNFIAVHAGRELAVVEVEGSRTTASVADPAVGFRAPAYSDDAEILAYAVAVEGGVAVMRALFQGTGSREIRRFAGGVALAFRPQTCELSVAVTRRPDTGTFDELWQMDLSQHPSHEALAWTGPFVSFAWSPEGSRLALIVPAQSGDGRYRLQTLHPDGRYSAATEPFLPSQDFRTAIGFFDQYNQSHNLWSPDGSHIVVSGRLANDSVSPSFGDPEGDFAMVWEVAPRSPFATLAPAELAFFPPLAKPLRR
ncbi:MAG: hypothetical protein ACR2HN_13945 [Tepidiformaceae bacterium]